MTMYSDYVKQMDAQLKQWDAEVVVLMTRTDLENTRSRTTQDHWMKELRASRDSARKTFREISLASEAATLEMKAAMEAAWGSMQSALKSAVPEHKT
jgi:hypothetical protein